MKYTVKATNPMAGKLHFYLTVDGKDYYLYSRPFTMALYRYFGHGRSLNEIKAFKKWHHNPTLDKTINVTLPKYIDYVLKYECTPA